MNIGKRLKQYRTSAHITQKELAIKLGIDHTVVSNWERGKNRIDVDMIPKICRILEITANDLMGFYSDFSLDDNEERLVKAYRNIGYPGNVALLDVADAMLYYKRKADKKAVSKVERPVFDLPASAGTGQFLDSYNFEMEEFLEDEVPRRAKFAIRVSGDSMEPDYPDGSLVFIEPVQSLEPGYVGVFVLNGEGYLKKLGHERNLVSLNPKYSDIVIGEYDDCRIIGKVVGSYEYE